MTQIPAGHYYVEFGGGLGDIFQQIYGHGEYAALERLCPSETVTVALVTHNPYVQELFAHHPTRSQLDVRPLGYWLPEDDVENRRRLTLPDQDTRQARRVPRRGGAVTFYPSAADEELLASIARRAADQRRPLVVFSLSAGEPYKSIPRLLIPRLVNAVASAGCLPVFVGRTYERNCREELKGPWLALGVDAIDRLSVPGTARLVQQAAGVVACHSSINMLAWMERRPQLLLYPRSLYDTFIGPRTQWAVGIDYPETVHGLFDDCDRAMVERFVMSIETTADQAVRAPAMAADVRDFLKTLPVTAHPHTGEDFTQTDWFRAWNGYPAYALAAATTKPTSVLEIGTLLGFGLASFIHGSDTVARITAMDGEVYVTGSHDACARNLEFFSGEKRFVRTLDAARGQYDLIHVDADHSFAGALHDIAFSWGLAPKVMLVDDYDFLKDVTRAVHAFAAHHGVPFRTWKSYRGWAVFAQPGVYEQLPEHLL
jgi:hypothetical protein